MYPDYSQCLVTPCQYDSMMSRELFYSHVIESPEQFQLFSGGGAAQCWRRFATQVSRSFRLPRRVFTVKDMFTTLLVPWNLKTKLLVIGRKDPYTVEQSPDPTLAILVNLCHHFVTIVSLLRHRAIIARFISHEFDTVTHLFPPTKVWLPNDLPTSCFRSEINSEYI